MSDQDKNNKSPQSLRPSVAGEKSAQAGREEEILKYWKEQDIFSKTTAKDAPGGEFIFFEGPPTANGRPGLHHAEARSFKDIIPRYKTMRGFRVARKAGWDTHGLPVELQVEKALGLKSKKEIETYGVAAFNQKCRESVWQYKDEWEKLTERMGFWVDMQNPYVTYKNSYIEALWSVIKRADERGHLYRDFRVGPWCSRCGTGLSSHELNQPGAYKDVKDLSVYVKFKLHAEQKIAEYVADEKTYIMAWTTTPWTLPGNVALAVGNEIAYAIVEITETSEKCIVANDLVEKIFEGREFKKLSIIPGEKLVGLAYEPLYPFLSDLISGDQKEKIDRAFQVYPAGFVTTTDGTGIVHTAVMYGAEDFELGTAVGLPKFHTVNEEGKFISGTGFLEGRYVKESDENGKPTLAVDIVDDLTRRNLLWKKENHMHSYPHCWRCDTPLLYYARTSWYFRMSALRDQMMKANETIGWEPDHIRDGRFGEWLDGIKDWGISRDRYWGTPLPVWTTDSGKNIIVGGIDDLKKYAKKSGNKYIAMRHGQAESNITNTWDFLNDPENHLTDEGKSQIRSATAVLREKNIDLIITSPIIRTQETAREVADALGISVENILVDDRIIEWQVGNEFQGKSIQSFLDIRNASENRYSFKVDGGESYQELIQRCGAFMYDLESKYQGKNILIVCHNSSARGIDLAASGFTFDALLKKEAKEFPFKNAEVREIDFTPLPHNENYELDFHKPFIDDVELELDGEKLVRTPEVMDVWFDSGCMPYAQDHMLGTPTNFDPKPADYIAEGLDQTRGWFYTLHAVANMLHDNPSQAYKNVICMGLLMDANGQKMSKSRGNVVGPWEMFDKYGADTVRLWMYSVNQPGDSKNFDEKGLDEVNKKFFNTLRNVVSFYELYRDLGAEEKNFTMENLNVLDSWIIARLFMVTRDMTRWLDVYNITDAARALRDFVDDLSTWYVRRSRDRLKDGDAAAKQVFYFVLMRFSKLLAPFVPFTAEDVYQKLRHDGRDAESVHLALWPDYVEHENIDRVIESMKQVRRLVTLGLEARQKVNVKVRQPLQKLSIPKCELSDGHLEILKDELNIKEIVIDEKLAEGEVVLDTEITSELQREGYARELMRALQDMRKKAGLNPTDVIALSIETNDAGRAVIESFQSEIQKVVNVKELIFGQNEGEEITVDDLVFKVKM